jgi:hypothetical protein
MAARHSSPNGEPPAMTECPTPMHHPLTRCPICRPSESDTAPNGEPPMADTDRVHLVNGWLAEEVDGCNCDGGAGEPHRPECGLEPIATVEDALTALAEVAQLRTEVARLRAAYAGAVGYEFEDGAA